jgi:hypothetical protein
MRAARRPGIARMPRAHRRSPIRDGVMGRPGMPPGNSHGLVAGAGVGSAGPDQVGEDLGEAVRDGDFVLADPDEYLAVPGDDLVSGHDGGP